MYEGLNNKAIEIKLGFHQVVRQFLHNPECLCVFSVNGSIYKYWLYI